MLVAADVHGRGSLPRQMATPTRRHGWSPLALGLSVAGALVMLSAAGAVGGGAPSAPGCAVAAGVHHAALVVEHLDGAVITSCVSFTSDRITGDQLLQLSHVEYATDDYGSMGKAVCQIDHEPATYPPGCWTSSSPYWAMYVSRGGSGWSVSNLGISSQTFGDGDAEGFRYESQSSREAPAPPVGICPLPQSSGTPAAGPGAGAVPPAASAPPRDTAPPTANPATAPSAALPAGSGGAAPTGTPGGGVTAGSAALGAAIVPPKGGSGGGGRSGSRGGDGTGLAATGTAGHLPAGPIAAAVLGASLLVLLVVQVVRGDRRRSPADATRWPAP